MRLLLSVLSLLAAACANVAVVDEGRLIRSAQLDEAALRNVAAAYGIRSVTTLRGERPEEDWYRAERRVCAELGIVLRSMALSPTEWPEAAEILKLLDAYDAGPWPMLVHCRAGADRTGLASALYLIHVRGRSVDEARGQLSAKHGHYGRLTGTGEMDEFLDLYEETANGKPLRRWVAEDYSGRLISPPSPPRR